MEPAGGRRELRGRNWTRSNSRDVQKERHFGPQRLRVRTTGQPNHGGCAEALTPTAQARPSCRRWQRQGSFLPTRLLPGLGQRARAATPRATIQPSARSDAHAGWWRFQSRHLKPGSSVVRASNGMDKALRTPGTLGPDARSLAPALRNGIGEGRCDCRGGQPQSEKFGMQLRAPGAGCKQDPAPWLWAMLLNETTETRCGTLSYSNAYRFCSEPNLPRSEAMLPNGVEPASTERDPAPSLPTTTTRSNDRTVAGNGLCYSASATTGWLASCQYSLSPRGGRISDIWLDSRRTRSVSM